MSAAGPGDVSDDDSELPATLVTALERTCDRFEAACRAGLGPRIEDYLGEMPEAGRVALAREMRALERAYRDRAAAPGPPAETATEPTAPGTAGRAMAGSSMAGYEILGDLGRGGMGEVLKARDLGLGRDLALKILLDRHRERTDLVGRFVEEAQICGQLQHPGVVPVYELGTLADHRPYFTMKLVGGRTLAALLHERVDANDDLSRFLGIFEQVCQTVAYAHAQGVIHRDLKPSNVMVGGFGEVQVMDWGLAKVLARGGEGDEMLFPAVPEAAGSTIRTSRSGSGIDGSLAGSVLGTPSYMAPEQARGEVDRVDERADVFGLGSILCEILTGSPAFTGRIAVEIHRDAAAGDLADASARLEACEADRELVDLTRACLAAEPADRPRTAGEVARKLTEYLAGVQARLKAAELARVAQEAKAEAAEARARAERRARRMTAALAASLLAMTTLGGLTFTYLLHQHQARDAAADRLLGRSTALLDQARATPDDPAGWRKVLEAVQQVADDPGGLAAERRARLAPIRAVAEAGLRAAERDATLRQSLVVVRANQQEAGPEATDAAYAAAFGAAELDLEALGVAEAAARLWRRPSAVVDELVAYLDHWSGVRRQARLPAAAWRKPLDVAQAADADDYRKRIRALLAADDLKAQAAKLKALAAEPQAGELPAATVVLMAGALEGLRDREAAVGLLRQAVERYPDDVWVNFALAGALDRLRPPLLEEAVRYYTAARALRSETAHDLAHVLERMGRGDQAQVIYRGQVARRPDARNLRCFGSCLMHIGRADEAREVLGRAVLAYRDAIRLKTDDAGAHYNLGYALSGLGKLAESEAEYRTAIRLQPDHAPAHIVLANVLADQGKLGEAEAGYRAVIGLQSENADAAHYNLGTVLEAQGKPGDAEAAYREALRLWPEFPEAHCNLGTLLRQSGRYAEALEELRRGHELGSRQFGWRYDSAQWVRDTERMVALNARLPAVLKGEDQPADAAERVILAGLAYDRKLYAAGARLYADALRARPSPAEDLQAGHRYNAACNAALAGRGEGKDHPPLDEAERARWRRQALDWLRSDLAAWTEVLERDKPDAAALVGQTLARWKQDGDLAGLRDSPALGKLPEGEKKACQAFWLDVDALLARARGRTAR